MFLKSRAESKTLSNQLVLCALILHLAVPFELLASSSHSPREQQVVDGEAIHALATEESFQAVRRTPLAELAGQHAVNCFFASYPDNLEWILEDGYHFNDYRVYFITNGLMSVVLNVLVGLQAARIDKTISSIMTRDCSDAGPCVLSPNKYTNQLNQAVLIFYLSCLSPTVYALIGHRRVTSSDQFFLSENRSSWAMRNLVANLGLVVHATAVCSAIYLTQHAARDVIHEMYFDPFLKDQVDKGFDEIASSGVPIVVVALGLAAVPFVANFVMVSKLACAAISQELVNRVPYFSNFELTLF